MHKQQKVIHEASPALPFLSLSLFLVLWNELSLAFHLYILLACLPINKNTWLCTILIPFFFRVWYIYCILPFSSFLPPKKRHTNANTQTRVESFKREKESKGRKKSNMPFIWMFVRHKFLCVLTKLFFCVYFYPQNSLTCIHVKSICV